MGRDGRGRSYLKRAGLTAERFVPDRFSKVSGARLYRTGDLVRRRSNGELEYLGRADGQVKVRGYRIELGEIEALLLGHGGVREAVVQAPEDERGERRLVAYVVAEPGAAALTMTELRRYLSAQLPDYMIPVGLVVLAALPLTPNGKVDRQALPEPEQNRATVGVEYAGARTAIEEILVGIWSDILDLPQVGIDDNFFELGGHSLLATQVISRVRRAFSLELPLRSLFEWPTVAGLGRAVEAGLRLGAGVEAPPLRAVARGGELPLSFAQQRLWFIEQLEPGSATYNIATAVRLTGRLEVGALERALSEVVRRHEALRTTFPTVAGVPVQRIGEAAALELAVTDLRGLAGAAREREVERLAAAAAQQPFDLAQGPLLRAGLLRLGAEEQVVLVTMHHIVSDGWSMGILMRELAALYGAYSQGQATPLGELAIQYGDYAVWQREWLQGAVLEGELGYWREQLAGAPPVLELPLDQVRPAGQRFRGARESLVVGRGLSEAVEP